MVSPVAVAVGVAVSNGFRRGNDGDKSGKNSSAKNQNNSELEAGKSTARYLDSGMIKQYTANDAIHLKINYKWGCFKDAEGDLDGNMAVEGLLKNISVQENFDLDKTNSQLVVQMHLTDANDPKAPPVYIAANLTDMHPVDDRSQFTPKGIAMQLLASLNAADLKAPIKIHPWLLTPGMKVGDIKVEKPQGRVMVSQMDSSTAKWKSLVRNYGDNINDLPIPPKKPVMFYGDTTVVVSGKESPAMHETQIKLLGEPTSRLIVDRTVWAPLMKDLLVSLTNKLAQHQREEESPDDRLDVNEQAKGLRPKQS